MLESFIVYRTFLTLKFESVLYDRGVARYDLEDGKGTLVFDTPSDKFLCTWNQDYWSPFSRDDEDNLNIDNFTKNPVHWSEQFGKNDNDNPMDVLYGTNKTCSKNPKQQVTIV